MGRPRNRYYLSAFTCFIIGGIVMLLPIDPRIREGGLTFIKAIGAGLLLIAVGFINYMIAEKDNKIEKEKDDKIKDLEEQLEELKKDKSND